MQDVPSEISTPPSPEKPALGQRLLSLDAFRGATIALMVLVNTPGDGHHVYGPLRHAEWNGWTPTDMVFPSFMWIVGVAMTISMARRLATGCSRGQLFLQALRRAAILYVLGLAIYVYPGFNPHTQRLMGVLQRIAICYLIAAAIYLTTKIRGQILWMLSLLAGYWLLMALIPVPGYGPGRLDVEGNFAHYVDSIVLGSHNYAATKTWDPEGIVSTLPAIATVLLGIFAGHVLRFRRPVKQRSTWLFALGIVLMIAGLICDLWLPINKKLWTSSFALFMAGLDFSIFAVFLWWIDGLGRKRLVRPLAILGMNAIAVYLASEFLDEAFDWIRWSSSNQTVTLRAWLYHSLFGWIANPMNASLAYAISYTALMYLTAYGMYRRGWYLKV